MSGTVKAIVGAGLLVVGVFLVGSGLLVRSILPEYFQATARIAADRSQGQGEVNPETSRAEVERLRSNEVLCRVITNLNLQQKRAERFKEGTPPPIDLLCMQVRSCVRVRRHRDTAALEISVLDVDRREAAQIANEIARVYQEMASLENRAVRLIDQAEPPVRPRQSFPWPCIVAVSLGGLLFVGGLVLLLTVLIGAGRPRPVAAD